MSFFSVPGHYPVAMGYFSNNGEILAANTQWLSYFGVRKTKEFNASLLSVQPCGTPSGELLNRYIQMAKENGESRFVFVNMRDKPIYLDIILQHKSSEYIIACAHDVSRYIAARELAEEKLHGSIQSVNDAKTRLLARMGHEIRTPITAIMGISEINLRSADIQPGTENAFARIYDSAKTLLGMVNNILDFSDLASGKITPVNEAYEVASLVVDTVQLHMVYLENRSIAFRVQVDENLPAYLLGDALRVRQIINNLLSNAIKYTSAGSVTLSLNQGEEQEPDAMRLVITVADTGHGMSKEQLHSISHNDAMHFYNREAAFGDGIGLGLTIVLGLSQIMGASIHFDSEEGKGTTVTVSIPQQLCGTETLGKETAQSLQHIEYGYGAATKKFRFEPEPMPYGKVLVVDDIAENLYVAKGLLAFYGLNIETCDSGYAAIEKVKAGMTYDIIFMDHMMPGMNGTETMRQLREMGYDKPIAVLTADAMAWQAEAFLQSGFDTFISKPIQTAHLNDVLIKYVRNPQPPEVLAAARASFAAAPEKNRSAPDISHYQNSPEVQQRLRVAYARHNHDIVPDIQHAVGSGDIKTAHRLSHNLKSIAALIGENVLAGLAKEVDQLLAAGTIPPAGQLNALENEHKRVLARIGPLDEPSAKPRVLDKEKAKITFDKLRPLLETRNVESLNFLDALRMIPDTEELAAQVEEFDLASALKTMEELRVKLGV